MLHYNFDPIYTTWQDPEVMKGLHKFTKPDGMEIVDQVVPGPNEGQDIEVRIYKPESNDKLPMIMNIHGGGFTTGSYENDNNRVIYLSMHIPAIFVSLNYRLAPEHVFPDAIEDCYAVWNWMYEAADKIGGDKNKMGLFGTSAGGNLCAGLAFYVRDHGGPKISLNALNVPALGIGPSLSGEQMRFDAPVISGQGLAEGIRTYIGGLNGMLPSYYAVPNVALDFSGLPPTLIVAAEYDPLRDESMVYAQKLMKDAIPIELYLMPRVGHGFDAVQAPMTDWIHDGVVRAFKREFTTTVEK